MKKILPATTCAILILLTATCKKDEAKSDAGTLTGKDWKMTAYTFTPQQQPGTDLYALMDSCVKDNLQHFNDDHTITQKNGAIKCDKSEPDTQSGGRWETIVDNNKLKVIDTVLDTTIYDIKTLTKTTLRLETNAFINGSMGTAAFTFAAQ
jgi:hypothetical protein